MRPSACGARLDVALAGRKHAHLSLCARVRAVDGNRAAVHPTCFRFVLLWRVCARVSMRTCLRRKHARVPASCVPTACHGCAAGDLIITVASGKNAKIVSRPLTVDSRQNFCICARVSREANGRERARQSLPSPPLTHTRTHAHTHTRRRRRHGHQSVVRSRSDSWIAHVSPVLGHCRCCREPAALRWRRG